VREDDPSLDRTSNPGCQLAQISDIVEISKGVTGSPNPFNKFALRLDLKDGHSAKYPFLLNLIYCSAILPENN
jgi:hypothetical protein